MLPLLVLVLVWNKYRLPEQESKDLFFVAELARARYSLCMDIKDQISAFGGVAALARRLGVTSQAVSQWEKIPLERACQLYRMPDCPLHPWEILPEVFEPPESA